MALGEWEGLTREEVAARFPADYERWCTAPHLLPLAAGEPLGAVALRVTAGVRELQEAHAGEAIVLVSHAIVIRLIVLDALGLGHERLWTVDATPAGITEIECEPGWATVHRMNTLARSEEHTSELQSRLHLVCRLLLEKKKKRQKSEI